MPPRESSFCGSRKQLPERQGAREPERPRVSALRKARPNSPPCRRPQLPRSPSGGHHGCHGRPTGPAIWGMCPSAAALYQHRWRQPRRGAVSAALPPKERTMLAQPVVPAETSCWLPQGGGSGPAIPPDWLGGAGVMTREPCHWGGHTCAQASRVPPPPVPTGGGPRLPLLTVLSPGEGSSLPDLH